MFAIEDQERHLRHLKMNCSLVDMRQSHTPPRMDLASSAQGNNPPPVKKRTRTCTEDFNEIGKRSHIISPQEFDNEALLIPNLPFLPSHDAEQRDFPRIRSSPFVTPRSIVGRMGLDCTPTLPPRSARLRKSTGPLLDLPSDDEGDSLHCLTNKDRPKTTSGPVQKKLAHCYYDQHVGFNEVITPRQHYIPITTKPPAQTFTNTTRYNSTRNTIRNGYSSSLSLCRPPPALKRLPLFDQTHLSSTSMIPDLEPMASYQPTNVIRPIPQHWYEKSEVGGIVNSKEAKIQIPSCFD